MASEPDRLGDSSGRPWRDAGSIQLRRLRVGNGLLAETLIVLTGLFIGITLLAVYLSLRFSLGLAFVASTASILAVIFALVIGALSGHPHARFGAANLVTAFRASLVSLAAATVLTVESLGSSSLALWALIAVVLFALSLDGVDGYLARAYQQESALGARFDMEVDALLILILSLAAALLHKAGFWVLLIGLMRYGFVAAGLMLPKLNGELFPSFRRKLVCVIQIAALCAMLVPFVTPPHSNGIAAVALLALIYSFAVDVLFLLRKPVAS